MKDNKISVIIPIYKVEAFIERCARSLMEQTIADVELIFVDDCSPDGSVEVLKRVIAEYPQRKAQAIILRHEANRGLPSARNTGLARATGEYIFHCDSDDYLEHDALEKMYEVAKREDADIVYTDWYLDSSSLTPPVGGRTRYMRCPEYKTSEEALRGLLHGTMKYNVWNKLVRKTLYGGYENENEDETLRYEDEDENEDNGICIIANEDPCCSNSYTSYRFRYRYRSIRFPEGHGMGEDMTLILLFARAKKVAYLPEGTYHYVRQNENAFTAARSEASYEDLLYNAIRVIDALTGDVSEEDLACFKLNTKFPFLISNRREDYERWQQWFPEANRYISSHQVSRRARTLERCARHHFFLPLRLHYQLLKLIR